MKIRKHLSLTKIEQSKISGGTGSAASGGCGGLIPIHIGKAVSEFGLVNVEQQRQLR